MTTKEATPTRPKADSPPTEVRSYFAKLLIENHGIPFEDATSHASKWKYGRGSEMAYYDIDTYREIFGFELGTLLFGYARKEIRNRGTLGPSGGRRVNVERKKEDLFGLEPGLSILYILLGAAVGFGVLAYKEKDANHDTAVGMMICSGISACAFVLAYVLFYSL